MCRIKCQRILTVIALWMMSNNDCQTTNLARNIHHVGDPWTVAPSSLWGYIAAANPSSCMQAEAEEAQQTCQARPHLQVSFMLVPGCVDCPPAHSINQLFCQQAHELNSTCRAATASRRDAGRHSERAGFRCADFFCFSKAWPNFNIIAMRRIDQLDSK
jgi:hypothetical protein